MAAFLQDRSLSRLAGTTFSGWCQQAIALIKVRHLPEQRLNQQYVLAERWKDHANCQRLALGWTIRRRELSAAVLKAWKGYRNPSSSTGGLFITVPSTSWEMLPAAPAHVPNTDRRSAPCQRTHHTSSEVQATSTPPGRNCCLPFRRPLKCSYTRPYNQNHPKSCTLGCTCL